MRRQWLAIGGALLLLLVGVLMTLEALAPDAPPATVGAAAPDFAAPLVPDSAAAAAGDGPLRSMAEYRGDVVLLNFWATWCEPCKVEMPSMEAVHRDFRAQGLRVVAVSEDLPSVSPAEIRAYARELGLTFDILRDTNRSVQAAYQVIGYPTTFLIARDGTVRRRFVGPEDWNSELNRAVMRNLLGMPRPEGD